MMLGCSGVLDVGVGVAVAAGVGDADGVGAGDTVSVGVGVGAEVGVSSSPAHAATMRMDAKGVARYMKRFIGTSSYRAWSTPSIAKIVNHYPVITLGSPGGGELRTFVTFTIVPTLKAEPVPEVEIADRGSR